MIFDGFADAIVQKGHLVKRADLRIAANRHKSTIRFGVGKRKLTAKKSEEGWFSGAVFSDESQNTAPGQSQIQFLQLKAGIGFLQILNFQCVQ